MKGNNLIKRVTASLLAVLMVFSAMPGFERIKAVDIDPTEHVSDDATIDNWKTFFGDDTRNAGAVWTDKSVFAQSADFDGQTIVLGDEDNFLVSLSAIASNKSIAGYSYRPTDTILVLDISGSMFQNIQSADAAANSRAAKIVDAANKAINSLLALNEHNRVGVIFYSNDVSSFLLPLDRYSASDGNYLTFEYQAPQNNNQGSGGGPNQGQDQNYTAYINTGDNLKDSDGNTVSLSAQVVGGTYIQSGLYEALQQFEEADTEIPEGEFQAGTTRLPIVVLMSDGAPTFGTTSFASVGDSNIGNGGTSSATDVTAFLTQLTAVYVKNGIEAHYDTESYFYTLGVGTSSDSVATSVLNPVSSSSGVINYWNAYNSASRSMSITLGEGKDQREYTITKNSLVTIKDRVYVDAAFSANSTTDITSAFNNIVNQIIIQSRYYPTNIESGDADLTGDISFKDELGLYMEVKEMKGILVGSTLYSGEAVAKSINNQDLGTVAEPTDLGYEFVRSVETRIGVDNSTAQFIIREAWLSGQLKYDSATGAYSNYIGWYADADGNYVGFWDGESLEAPANYPNAVYANKSYGYIGVTNSGAMASDMMYTCVQVHTNIETGQVAVIFKIPAAIIPVISYDVQLDGDSYETSTKAEVTKSEGVYPIRLVYEVGLRADINELNVAEKVGTDYIRYNAETGAYTFYSNRWDDHPHKSGEHHPDEHINAISYFTPSEENERYYYIEDTLIYTDTNGTLYTGETAPYETEDTYYRAYYVFSNDNGIETEYEEIHRNDSDPGNSTLHKAVQNDSGRWVIPLGTIHRYDYGTTYFKTQNQDGTYGNTKTYEYVTEPVIGHFGDTFFSTRFLGNNGKLTIVPAQGIKLSKIVEGVLPEGEHTFEFTITNITNSADNGSYDYVRYAADGTETEGTVTFTDGKATVTLEAGETMYIINLTTYDTFEVEEDIPDGSYYYLKSVNGSEALDKATITVQEFVISDAEFVNAYIGSGHLVVSKTVTHDLGDDYVIPEDMSFEIKVDVGTELAGSEYDTIIQHANGTVEDDGTVMVGDDGIITLEINDGDVVLIQGIPTGTAFSVTETEASGFVPSIEGAQGEISNEENAYVYVTNDYQPDPADTLVLSHEGTKEIVGRDWLDTDEFTFVLEKFDGSNFVEIDRVTVTSENVNASELAEFSFTDKLQSQVFDEAGTYQYRVREIAGTIGGVEYTHVIYNVLITVGDTEMDGKLDILSVDTSRTVENGFIIETPFVNSYSAKGGATVTLNIQKLIEDINGSDVDNVSLEGYKFQVYDLSGNPVGEEMVTDANGTVSYDRTYTSDAIGLTYDYVIREVKGDVQGIVYTTDEYYFSVSIIDNLDGTVGAVIYETGSQNEGSSYGVSFTNTYDPRGEIVLEGTKFFNSSVEGVGLINHSFRFEVTEDGVVVAEGYNAGTVASGETTLEDAIIFDAIEYTIDDLGTHTYTVTEVKGDTVGVTYDDREITVVVEVSDDGSGVLKAEVVTAESEAIVFTNSYEPEKTDLTITIEGATKILSGRDMEKDEFEFYVYPIDEETGEADMSNKVATGTNEAANDGEKALITFSPISISTNKPETLKFLVVENKGSAGGIYYSLQQFVVEVTIEINTDGVCYISEISHEIAFENKYTPESDEVLITGIKYLDGRDLKEGEFSFELKDENGKVLQTKANAAYGIITFDPIEYTLEDAGKTFIYTVSEVVGDLGGVTYDEAEKTVKVKVVDDGNGQIIATITNDSDTVSFLNEYEHTPAEVTVTATKKIVGREMDEGEFEFEVLDPNGDQVATAANTAGEESSLSFTFSAQKSGTYTVREIKGSVDGITYSTDVYYINVTVTDNGDGTATAAYAVIGGSEIVFTNTYEASGSLTIEATKTITGKNIAEETFSFELKDEDGNLLQTKANDGTDITFDAIDFTLEDVGKTFTYTVSEVDEGKEGYTYDDTVYTVTVEVTDGGHGELIIKAEGTENILFENSYGATVGTLTFEGSKSITGDRTELTEDDVYEFIVKDENGITVDVAENDAQGVISFEIPLTATGEFKFYISEVEGDDNTVTYDEKEIVIDVVVTDNGDGELIGEIISDVEIAFENIYTKPEVTVPIRGTKTLDGRGIKANEFAFIITSEDGEYTDTVYNNAQGAILFEITYDTPDTYVYTVVEDDSDNELGMTYDRRVYTVTVTVNDDFTYRVETTLEGEETAILFENSYEKIDTNAYATVNGTKVLSGRDLKVGEFSFTIIGSDGTNKTVTNALDGSISFGTFVYTDVGEYTYTVSEVKGGNKDITYDNEVYTVTVTVTDSGNGVLVASAPKITCSDGSAADGIIFNNKYDDGDMAPKGTYVEILVKKDIVDNTGDGYDLDGFVFTLTNETTGDTYTAISNASGYATFGIHIAYEEIGNRYKYTITELDTQISGMEYDETVHEFEIYVSYIPTINLATTYITKDGETVRTKLMATFTNTYNGIKDITPPDGPDIDPEEPACEEEEVFIIPKRILFTPAYCY